MIKELDNLIRLLELENPEIKEVVITRIVLYLRELMQIKQYKEWASKNL